MTETNTTYSVVPAPNVPEANINSPDVITLGDGAVTGNFFNPGQFGTTGGDFTSQRRTINHVAAGAMSRAIMFPYSISSYRRSRPELAQPHWVGMETAYGAPFFPKYDGHPVSGNENANNASISSSLSTMSWASYGGADVRGQSFHSDGEDAFINLRDDKFMSSIWEISCSSFYAGRWHYGFSLGSSVAQGSLHSGSTQMGSITNTAYEFGQYYNSAAGRCGPTAMAPVTVGWTSYNNSGGGEDDTARQVGTSIVHAAAIDDLGGVHIRVEGQWGNKNRFPRSFLVESNVVGTYISRTGQGHRSERYDTADCSGIGTVAGGTTTPDGHTYFTWPSGTASVESSPSAMSSSGANSVWRTTAGYRVKLTPIF